MFQVSLDMLILGEISGSREKELKEHLHKQEVLIHQLKESMELAIFVLNFASQNN